MTGGEEVVRGGPQCEGQDCENDAVAVYEGHDSYYGTTRYKACSDCAPDQQPLRWLDERLVTDGGEEVGRAIKQGDRVRFTDVHHAMNRHLKQKEGEVGTVVDDDRGWEGKLYVEFDDSFGSRFKIARERVEVVDRAE